MKYLKYNHPAATKYSLTEVYELDELKKELELEMIQVLFTPVGDWTFEDLIEKKAKKPEVRLKEELEI